MFIRTKMSYVVRNTSSSDSDKPPIYVNIVGYNNDTKILATKAAGMYKYTTTYILGSKGYLRQTPDTIYYLTEDGKLTIVHGQNTINYGNYLNDCFQRSSDTISATPFKLDVMLSTGDTPANCIRLYTSDSAATPPSSCQPDPQKDSPCSPLPANCTDGTDCCKALGAQSTCIGGLCNYVHNQNSQSLLNPSELQKVKCGTGSTPSPPTIYVNIIGYDPATKQIAKDASGKYTYTTGGTYSLSAGEKSYTLDGSVNFRQYDGASGVSTAFYLTAPEGRCRHPLLHRVEFDTVNPNRLVIKKMDVMLIKNDTSGNCMRLYTSDSDSPESPPCIPDQSNATSGRCFPLPENCSDAQACCKAAGQYFSESSNSQCAADGYCTGISLKHSPPGFSEKVKCSDGSSPSKPNGKKKKPSSLSPCNLSSTTISPCSLGSCGSSLARGKKCELECPPGETGNSYISCGSGGGIYVNCDCSPGSGKKKKPHSKPNGKKKKPSSLSPSSLSVVAIVGIVTGILFILALVGYFMFGG